MAKSLMPNIPEINLKSFCFCFSIRVGSLIIGWLGLILSAFLTLFIVRTILLFYGGSAQLIEVCFGDVYCAPNGNSTITKLNIFISSCLLLVMLFSTVLHYLLIRGVIEKKPSLMHPYVYWNFTLILSTIFTIILWSIYLVFATSVEGAAILKIVMLLGLFLVPLAYCFMITASYCQLLLAAEYNCNRRMPDYDYIK